MRTYLDAKTMAKTLRQSLKERQIDLSHSESLELVAKQLGLHDWNTLAARIEAAAPDKAALVLPRNWFITGRHEVGNYRAGLDPDAPNTAMVESRFKLGEDIDPDHPKFGVLMQRVEAGNYRGHRLRFSASLRTEEANCGTIWMRIDGKDSSLRFDNMMTRPIAGALTGSVGWTEREIVLDVPEEADSICFGFFLAGRGKVWARNLRLDIVGEAVPTTAGERLDLPQPTNLDFDAERDERA